MKRWLFIVFLALSVCAPYVNAQDEQSDSKESSTSIEDSLTDILKGLPTDSNDEEDESIVAKIETQIAEIEKTKRTKQTKSQRTQLGNLRMQLRYAKIIESQFARTRMSKAKENRGKKSDSDTFVVAYIDIPSSSREAKITFDSVTGQDEVAHKMFDYIKETPSGAVHDYRIMGRYIDSELAHSALKQARTDYDKFRQYQEQMIQYIQNREREIALQRTQARRRLRSAIRSTRRC